MAARKEGPPTKRCTFTRCAGLTVGCASFGVVTMVSISQFGFLGDVPDVRSAREQANAALNNALSSQEGVSASAVSSKDAAPSERPALAAITTAQLADSIPASTTDLKAAVAAAKEERRKKYLRMEKGYAEETAKEERARSEALWEARRKAQEQLAGTQVAAKPLGGGYTAPDVKAEEWWKPDEEPSNEEQFDEWLNEISAELDKPKETKAPKAERWHGAYAHAYYSTVEPLIRVGNADPAPAQSPVAQGSCQGVEGEFVWVDRAAAHSLVNLAELSVNDGLPLTISMSSSLPPYPSQNCVDGNPDTFCANLNEEQWWISLQLPNRTCVTKITLVNRKDCCMDRIAGAKVSVKGTSDGLPIWSSPVDGELAEYTFSPKRTGEVVPTIAPLADAVGAVTVPPYVLHPPPKSIVALLVFGPSNQFWGLIEAAALATVMRRQLVLLPWHAHYVNSETEHKPWPVTKIFDTEAIVKGLPFGFVFGEEVDALRNMPLREVLLKPSLYCGLQRRDDNALQCDSHADQVTRLSLEKQGPLANLLELCPTNQILQPFVNASHYFPDFQAEKLKDVLSAVAPDELPVMTSYNILKPACFTMSPNKDCDRKIQEAVEHAAAAAIPAPYIRKAADWLVQRLGGQRKYLVARIRVKDDCLKGDIVSWPKCFAGMTAEKYVDVLYKATQCTGMQTIYINGPPKAMAKLWPQVKALMASGTKSFTFHTLDSLDHHNRLEEQGMRDFQKSMVEQEIVAQAAMVLHGNSHSASRWLRMAIMRQRGMLPDLDMFSKVLCADRKCELAISNRRKEPKKQQEQQLCSLMGKLAKDSNAGKRASPYT